uniref:Major capsid protein n=1 Tax=Dulem virus 189 TaxID=3145666 RepID=A0AAU8AXZ7_9VIRU
MNRNTESHFALNPTRIDMSRSTFDRSSSLKTSFNVGDLVPFYLDEVLPGDTFKIKTSKVVRLQTLLTPMMDNIYLDTYYFFVPNRLTWNHWKEFNGENTESAWIPQTEYEVPQITAPEGGWNVGTIADYFGLPTGVAGLSVSSLPFRAYSLIVNEWFRDQNLQDPLVIPLDDATVEGVNTGTFVTDVAKGGLPFICAKYHDYFTSALPAPQKGPDVTIPVSAGANLPVVGNGFNLALAGASSSTGSSIRVGGIGSLLNSTAGGSSFYGTNGSEPAYGLVVGTAPPTNTSALRGMLGVPTKEQLGDDLSKSGLIAINDGAVSMATINQLRLAFQIQKMYERDARGGTRYIEILKSHFGVTSPDARLQRPEYLGGNRVPISINQVIQQSSSTSSSPQGNVAGQSLTTDSHYDFTKSFTEHGFVIGLMVARYDHTYQQGIDRMWSRKDRFDYYWPVFANIGEQAIKNKEIYAQGNVKDDEVFGYQEAWADYRYKPNRVTGEMRSSYAQSLDVWHLGDDYSALPSLSDSWIREDKTNVDRVLAVTSSVSNQLFADVFVSNRTTRPMPMYSIPGLIDHH